MTIGGQLRSARQNRGYDLSAIAEETKISRMYLEAIEADKPALLPGQFFYKSFVRQYAQALDLNPERFVFDEPDPEPAPLPVAQPLEKAKPVRDRDQFVKLIDSPRLGERRLATFFALMCVLAGGAMIYSWTQPSTERETSAHSTSAPTAQQQP